MRTGTRISGGDGGDLPSQKANAEEFRFRKFSGSVALVCDLLDQRRGDVSESEMATIFGCSERQARRVFHCIAGESFRRAQVRARLAAAKALVRHSLVPISQISEDLGYSRRAKFDKSYESVFGITPAADRLVTQKEKFQEMATQGVDREFHQVYRAAPTIVRR